MKCQFCGSTDSKVLDSRNSVETNSIRRRRECLNCSKRFTTFETIETVPIMVIKHDGRRQQFDSDKIKRGIIRACEKRPISIAEIDKMVDNIFKQAQSSLEQEILSSKIGELVMQELKQTDEVAYIRFASVYRKFADITHFMDFIKECNPKKQSHKKTND